MSAVVVVVWLTACPRHVCVLLSQGDLALLTDNHVSGSPDYLEVRIGLRVGLIPRAHATKISGYYPKTITSQSLDLMPPEVKAYWLELPWSDWSMLLEDHQDDRAGRSLSSDVAESMDGALELAVSRVSYSPWATSHEP